ncbi:MAG: thiamine pyrophosphate-binding protein [Prolixibacteraceae bacterium]
MTTVARHFAQTLKEIGVRYVFGVPSGNMTDYIEALRKEEGIDFVLTGHESAAAFMAAVCGRLTGTPGACFGTFGPGATNLSTGVGCAFLDRYPMLAFTDEMPANKRDRTVQMNIDHQALFQPITKFATRLEKDAVREVILKASGIATSGYPGPVYIGVPAGMAQEIPRENKKELNYLQVEKEPQERIEKILTEEAVQLFHDSKKPLLAVGMSAVRAGVRPEIIKLAEQFEIPVVLTPMAKGMFPENHRLYAGVLFHALSVEIVKFCKEADLIVGVGYDPVELNYENWMPGVPLIHLDEKPADVDFEKIKNSVHISSIYNGLKVLFELKAESKNWNLSKLQKMKADVFGKLVPPEQEFDPRNVIAGLRNGLPEEGILTVDVGAHLHLAGQQWQTPAPEKLLMTNGWSSMGFAVPAAIAAKLCHPDLPVTCLSGDGGFRMMAGEMATARRLNLNIVFVLVADQSLSLIRIKQGRKNFDDSYGTDLETIADEPANHIFGVPVVRVSESFEYQKALGEAFAQSGPVIIEAVVNGKGYDGLVLE